MRKEGHLKKLHLTQEALLKLLTDHLYDPLTIRELQRELKLTSPSIVSHHIEQLEKKGYLKRNPFNPRDYQILSNPEKPIVYLNLYGLAECGPNGSILDGNPLDRIPIAARLIKFPTSDAFLVEAKGKSMEPKIKPGDLIIAQKKHVAQNGDIIICINNSETLVKRFYQIKNQIKLHSENPKFEPFSVSSDFRIEGIVKGTINYH